MWRIPEPLLRVVGERPHVHADADRGTALDRQPHDLTGLHRVGDVSGVQPQLGYSGLDRCERHAVVEVDVGDDRDRGALDDRREARCILGVLAGDPDDLAARHRETVDLLERRVDVRRVGGGHGLNGDRMIAPDPDPLRVRLAGLVLEVDGLGLAAQADHTFHSTRGGVAGP
jgi:hypothetical protein